MIAVEPTSSARLATVQDVVPDATPEAPLSVDQLTCVTPNASLAVPPSASVADDVEKALASRWVELSLAALEMDGRRHRGLGNRTQARERFETLQNRALDLHQRHYAARAERWLGELR